MKHEELLKDIDGQIEENRYLKSHCMSSITDNVLRNNNNLLGKIKTVLRTADKDYERGCEDAWELARKFFGSTVNGAYSASEFYQIFDNCGSAYMMHTHTYQEALAKVEAYEKKKKEEEEAKKPVIGDVVECVYKYNCSRKYKGIVRGVTDTHVYIMTKESVHTMAILKSEFDIKKTDKHFNIQGMLDKL